MFNPVNALETSLVHAVQDVSKRPQFYKNLLEHDIYAISLAAPEGTAEGGQSLKLLQLEKDAIFWIPIFSSLEQLQAFLDREMQYVRLRGADFFKFSKGAHIVINPNADYGKELLPEEIEKLLDGSLFRPPEKEVLKAGTRILLDQPSSYPTTLIRALKPLFASNPAIKAAYVAQCVIPDQDSNPRLLVGLEAEGSIESTIADASAVLQQLPDVPLSVDFYLMKNRNDIVSQYLLLQTSAFYLRSV